MVCCSDLRCVKVWCVSDLRCVKVWCVSDLRYVKVWCVVVTQVCGGVVCVVVTRGGWSVVYL